MIKKIKRFINKFVNTCTCKECGVDIPPSSFNYGGYYFCCFDCFFQFIKDLPYKEFLELEKKEKN